MSDPTDGFRWWLRLQITLGLLGGAVWLAGAILEQAFVAGVGCGILIGGLILRLGRKGVGGPSRTS